MKKFKIKYKIHEIITENRGLQSLLAEVLGVTPSTVYRSLVDNRVLMLRTKMRMTSALNQIIQTEYTVDDMFTEI